MLKKVLAGFIWSLAIFFLGLIVSAVAGVPIAAEWLNSHKPVSFGGDAFISHWFFESLITGGFAAAFGMLPGTESHRQPFELLRFRSHASALSERSDSEAKVTDEGLIATSELNSRTHKRPRHEMHTFNAVAVSALALSMFVPLAALGLRALIRFIVGQEFSEWQEQEFFREILRGALAITIIGCGAATLSGIRLAWLLPALLVVETWLDPHYTTIYLELGLAPALYLAANECLQLARIPYLPVLLSVLGVWCWSNSRHFVPIGREITISSRPYDKRAILSIADDNTIFVGGATSTTAWISKADSSGKLIWSFETPEEKNTNQMPYFRGLAAAGGGVLACGSSIRSRDWSALLKYLDKDGIEEQGSWTLLENYVQTIANDLTCVRWDNDFALLGLVRQGSDNVSTRRYMLMRVSGEGHVLWQKEINVGNDGVDVVQIMQSGGLVLMTDKTAIKVDSSGDLDNRRKVECPDCRRCAWVGRIEPTDNFEALCPSPSKLIGMLSDPELYAAGELAYRNPGFYEISRAYSLRNGMIVVLGMTGDPDNTLDPLAAFYGVDGSMLGQVSFQWAKTYDISDGAYNPITNQLVVVGPARRAGMTTTALTFIDVPHGGAK